MLQLQRLIICLATLTTIQAAYVNLGAPFAPVGTVAPVPNKFQPIYAIARIFPSMTQNSTVQGFATFVDNGSSTTINVNLAGLSPGQHGIHIHEYADASQDCAAWGGHFDNPASPQNHGAPNAPAHHLGDLGNLVADATGRTTFSITVNYVTLYGDLSVLGRGLAIHAGQDDLGLGSNTESLINGNSGPRVACGPIALAVPPATGTTTGTPPPAALTSASTIVAATTTAAPAAAMTAVPSATPGDSSSGAVVPPSPSPSV